MPKKNPPENAPAIVRELAAKGVHRRSISKALGVSHDTFLRWQDDHPEIYEALHAGLAEEHDALVRFLFDQAKKGNTTAAIFLLKTRHGYRENEPLDQRPNVTINFELPGATDPKTYEAQVLRKSIEGGKKTKQGKGE
jgi:hypothetical protein